MTFSKVAHWVTLTLSVHLSSPINMRPSRMEMRRALFSSEVRYAVAASLGKVRWLSVGGAACVAISMLCLVVADGGSFVARAVDVLCGGGGTAGDDVGKSV